MKTTETNNMHKCFTYIGMKSSTQELSTLYSNHIKFVYFQKDEKYNENLLCSIMAFRKFFKFFILLRC